jgi:hypothetical protein
LWDLNFASPPVRASLLLKFARHPGWGFPRLALYFCSMALTIMVAMLALGYDKMKRKKILKNI